MSFAGIGNGSLNASAAPQATKKKRGIQFFLYVAVAVATLWYAHRMPIDTHSLPADFAGRLRMLAPALGLFTVGMFCLFKALFLYKDWERRVEIRKAAEDGRSADTTQQLSGNAKLLYRSAFVLLFYIMTGLRFIRALWPAQSNAIAGFASIAFLVLMLIGMLLNYRGHKTQIVRGKDLIGRSRNPIVLNNAAIVAMTLVMSAAALFAVHRIAKMIEPAHIRAIDGAAVTIVFAAVLFMFHWLSRSTRIGKEDEGDSQFATSEAVSKSIASTRTRGIVALVVFETVIMQFLHRFPRVSSAIFWGQIVLITLALIALAGMKQWVHRQSRAGNYDRAFYWDSLFAKVPGYGKPLKGLILFNAGRYEESLAFLKPLAFDASGNPLLATIELYCYALAIENSGRCEEAEKLLDAAVKAYPDKNHLQVALAGCLLTEEKEAGRACLLLEQAMASSPGARSYGLRVDRATRVARYAWALASSGRRSEAEQRIQEAFDLSKELKGYDVAGVQYFTGEAWRMMGEATKSRRAFEEAIRLHPDSCIEKNARNGLAKLGKTGRAWS